MRFSIAPAFVLVGLASQSLANVFTTFPVASTVIQAGQPFTIQWQLNSDQPANLENAQVGLYVGTTNVQEQVISLAASVATANVTSLNVTIPPNVGADYNGYFIRFTSTSVPSPTDSQFFGEAFSAMFTINGMTGTFSPAALAAIHAANTTSSSSTPSSSSSPPSFVAATNSASNPSSSPSSSSTGTKSASTTSTTSKPSQTPASSALSTSINMVLFGAFVFGSAGLLL